jgi:hypothetical protein
MVDHSLYNRLHNESLAADGKASKEGRQGQTALRFTDRRRQAFLENVGRCLAICSVENKQFNYFSLLA